MKNFHRRKEQRVDRRDFQKTIVIIRHMRWDRGVGYECEELESIAEYKNDEKTSFKIKRELRVYKIDVLKELSIWKGKFFLGRIEQELLMDLQESETLTDYILSHF